MSRRAVLGGAGAGILAAGGLADAAAVSADPMHLSGGVAAGMSHPDGAPYPTSIASAPLSGLTYQVACQYEFRPFDPAAQATFGGHGVYCAGTASVLRAFFDLPPNAVVHDIEWYVYNNSGSSTYASMWQFAAGNGYITTLSADAVIPVGNGSDIAAIRQEVPAASAGPFPPGSKLLVGMNTPTNGTIQLNGVRIGYSNGQATVGLLPAPVRAYNSRTTGGILKKGKTRVVTLPANLVGPGTTGVLATVTAVSPAHAGYLKVYAANEPAPADPALHFGTATVATSFPLGVSAARKIKIDASVDVQVTVDITGTLG